MTDKANNPWAQNKDDIAAMAEYYKAHFSEVYLIHCMENDHVIGVEVAPAKNDGVILRAKQRTLYTYQELCLSVRERMDTNGQGGPMYGYQCACGNNTILAAVEKGEVAERTIVKGPNGQIVDDSGPIAASSPFERAQQQTTIRLKAAQTKADYETDGTVERYETFKLERVK